MDPDERLADVGWLNEILDAGASWPHGHLAWARRERIGVGYGLSGVVHRLHATTTTGRQVTLVAKREEAAKIERATTARAHVESAMGRAMPASYGCHIDERLDDGLILLEDVGPAVQGDELAEVDRAHASQLVAVVAMLHTRTLPVVAASTPMADRWQPTTPPETIWLDRVDRAAARYSDLFDVDRRARVSELRDSADAKHLELLDVPLAWLHIDPHLDNVMWRADGTAVLLDWSNARLGPPAVDVAVMLRSISFARSPPLSPDELFDAYCDEARRSGGAVDRARLVAASRSALAIHLRGIVGWMGEISNDGHHDRKARLRDDAARRVLRALDWLDQR